MNECWVKISSDLNLNANSGVMDRHIHDDSKKVKGEVKKVIFIMHIATNAGHTAQNDGRTAQNDGWTVQNDGRTAQNDSRTAQNDGRNQGPRTKGGA